MKTAITPPAPCAPQAVVPSAVLHMRALPGVAAVTEPVALFPEAYWSARPGSPVEMDLTTARRAAAAAHLPTLLCQAKCTACPEPARWPQTKFMLKRISRSGNDTSGVRAYIDGLGLSRASSAAPAISATRWRRR